MDFNRSTDRALSLGSLEKKFLSFDWDVETIDGHHHEQIFKALSLNSNKPRAVIAQTIKGYGCRSMENNPEWHHRSPNAQELLGLLEEVR